MATFLLVPGARHGDLCLTTWRTPLSMKSRVSTPLQP
jgi:hypothetical protein